MNQEDIEKLPKDSFGYGLGTENHLMKIMGEKYYTPTIDEFYVGFEYEYKPMRGDWFSIVLQAQDYDYPGQGELAEIVDNLKSNRIRVKYLDKEDIESLGLTKFNYTYNKEKNLQAEESQYFSHWYKDFKDFNADSRLIINLQTQVSPPLVSIWWEVYSPFINEHNGLRKSGTDIFSGRLKNKSEFIKLLKQLAIQ